VAGETRDGCEPNQGSNQFNEEIYYMLQVMTWVVKKSVFCATK
jgi:hypothetical protein